MRRFSHEELEDIKARRLQGEAWEDIGDTYKMTARGLKVNFTKAVGKVELPAMICEYCNKSYIPVSITKNCPEKECQRLRKNNIRRNELGMTIVKYESHNTPKKTMRTKCLGNYCGGKMFTTKVVQSHGRDVPLYRICPNCKRRNEEFSIASCMEATG